MNWRNKNNRQCYAVTPILGASLVIFIVTTAIGSFLLVGMPYINNLESEGNFQDLEVLCSVVVDNIDDITVNKPGEQKVIPFTVDKGSISTNKDEYDKMIVIYSNESNEVNEIYDFNVAGLDDGDYQFNIIFNSGVNQGQFTAHVHWIDGELAGHREEDVVVEDEGNNGIVDLGDDSFNLKGTVEIFINDASNSDLLVGKIWLFDSNFLTCELTSGETPYVISIEKGGLVYTDDQQISRVERPFDLNAEDDFLQMKIVQLKALKSFSISGSNVHTKISANSITNDVREMKRLYFIKIQFHGHNAQTWINYFSNKYDEFVPTFDSNTLFYTPSNPSISPNGVWMAFSNSLVEINIL